MKIVEIIYRCDGSDAAVRPRPVDAHAARDRLDDGSRSMAVLLGDAAEGSGVARRIVPVDPRDLGLVPGVQPTPRQRPYAAVVGCSDARVPIELIFKEGPNDLFVVRVAGNGLGNDALGSLRYAFDHLGESLKLIVVLGHSGCGAVSAAVDVFLKPEGYLALAAQHNLRNILDRLVVVVHAAARRMAAVYGPDVVRQNGYRDALIESAIVANAALSAHTVEKEVGGSDRIGLRAAYGVYLLAEHRVWAPRIDSASSDGLAYPPTDAAAFDQFADAVVRSARIAALLESGANG